MDQEFPWYFDNQTNDTIDVYLAFGYQTAYPDTNLPVDPNKANISGVFPHEKGLIHLGEYEKIIKRLPKDTLSVFLFLHDTLKKYNWREVREDYKILKRYDMSLYDLQILEFTIPHPPDGRMKGMKMYPPYKE
jgi:hypothetical protein